jgi:phospholipid/cholesterol/gamma-HCH transport system substrate-binding protein
MDDRIFRFRLGVVVAAAAGILVLMIMLMGDLPRPFTSRYDIYVNFPNAPGVSIGTPVRKSGIHIGRVSDVQFLDNDRGVQLTLQIDGERRVFEDELCRISSASILGDSVVEFYRPDNQAPQGKPLPPRILITNGLVSSNPADVLVNLEGDVRRALNSVESAGQKIQLVAQNLNSVVGENQDQIPRILAKTERSLDNLDQAFSSMREVFGDPELRQKLKTSLEDLPMAISDARVTLGQIRDTFTGFEKVTARAESNLANLEKFTAPLGERGPAIASNIESSIGKIDALLEQLVEFGENLNSREGTLGQLLNDDELYLRLNRTVANAEDITRRLRPVVEDFRVASDKIARDPGIVGVRGALDRRPVGTGSKGLFMNYEPQDVKYRISNDQSSGAW